MITVIATRHEAIRSFAIIPLVMFLPSSWGGFLERFHCVRHTCEAINAPEFVINTFATQPIADGRTCIDGLNLDTFGSEVVSQLAERMCTLQVQARRG